MNNNQSYNNPSQSENQNRDVKQSVLQGDAIYDYERVPAAWYGFDEQPVIYRYGDASVWQSGNEGEGKLAS